MDYARPVLLFALVFGSAGTSEAFTTCIDSNVIVGEVRGIVVFENKGREWTVPGATIALFNPTEGANLIAEAKADDAAKFAIPNVRPGKYRLRVESPGLLSAYAEIRVRPRRFGLGPKDRRVLKVALSLVLGPCPVVQSVSETELSVNSR